MMKPITEIVVLEKSGLLFRGLNIQEAVKQFYGILNHPELHQHMSNAALIKFYSIFR
jgi:L-malate glycosyltransferase